MHYTHIWSNELTRGGDFAMNPSKPLPSFVAIAVIEIATRTWELVGMGGIERPFPLSDCWCWLDVLRGCSREYLRYLLLYTFQTDEEPFSVPLDLARALLLALC